MDPAPCNIDAGLNKDGVLDVARHVKQGMKAFTDYRVDGRTKVNCAWKELSDASGQTSASSCENSYARLFPRHRRLHRNLRHRVRLARRRLGRPAKGDHVQDFKRKLKKDLFSNVHALSRPKTARECAKHTPFSTAFPLATTAHSRSFVGNPRAGRESEPERNCQLDTRPGRVVSLERRKRLRVQLFV